ncbi:hypothetical protein FA95DRAFT_781851 [Auriscalpium vulgare]|uniref:Uncharacterized protein n=1 Tax=Auriscalpium vulgare TaxID=40419 RepID=A0ACB8RBK3_9AGAM|nr:hypothetical protein FA95DRAFT_781851 [Auriscalpium vulgare]
MESNPVVLGPGYTWQWDGGDERRARCNREIGVNGRCTTAADDECDLVKVTSRDPSWRNAISLFMCKLPQLDPVVRSMLFTINSLRAHTNIPPHLWREPVRRSPVLSAPSPTARQRVSDRRSSQPRWPCAHRIPGVARCIVHINPPQLSPCYRLFAPLIWQAASPRGQPPRDRQMPSKPGKPLQL